MQKGFAGTWFTTFGAMLLEHNGSGVSGSYRYGAVEGTLKGTVRGRTLLFSYVEPSERGTGRFRLVRSGKFAGEYRPKGQRDARRWDGHRGWDGLWDTDFGRMRLAQDGSRVGGSYAGSGHGSISGTVRGDELSFRYKEKRASGEGRFSLCADGTEFAGQWRARAKGRWMPWTGRRTQPIPGITWLLVLEAYWQRSLVDPEYSFGNMLREVFARQPQVRVRQRFFHDSESLLHWCRELHYLPEPAILMIASHGLAEGLSVRGELVDTRRVIESLGDAENLKLLHFSSCLVGADGRKALRGNPWPISGYTTSVDWGASALLEFTYLDLMLNRGLSPAQAAAALPRLVPYAGDRAPRGSPYRAAGFRFFPPR